MGVALHLESCRGKCHRAITVNSNTDFKCFHCGFDYYEETHDSKRPCDNHDRYDFCDICGHQPPSHLRPREMMARHLFATAKADFLSSISDINNEYGTSFTENSNI